VGWRRTGIQGTKPSLVTEHYEYDSHANPRVSPVIDEVRHALLPSADVEVAENSNEKESLFRNIVA